jgi:2-keto-4-pentenoate hydratase/2-oxohepta-3-ene-1,7-dioic acid hydratase in catechol pathway
MKLARFNITSEPVTRARTGVVLDGDIVGDLRAGYAKYLVEEAGDIQGREIAALRIPPDVKHILHVGRASRQAIEAATIWLAAQYAKRADAKGLDAEQLFTPLAQARLHNPLKPGALLFVHQASAGSAPRVHFGLPASVMGPVRDIPLPATLQALGYGAGLGIVIGQRCHACDERGALTAIAGYLVANEIVEPPASLPGADNLAGERDFRRCIIGPYLTDAIDVPQVEDLRVTTRINGKVCQLGSTAIRGWSIARLIARLSVQILEPGDVVITGLLSDHAPAGVGMVPYLRAGDVIESEIDGIGLMRNKVVVESA